MLISHVMNKSEGIVEITSMIHNSDTKYECSLDVCSSSFCKQYKIWTITRCVSFEVMYSLVYSNKTVTLYKIGMTYTH